MTYNLTFATLKLVQQTMRRKTMAIITKSKLIEYIRYGLISQTWFDKLPEEKQKLLRDVRKEYERME